MLRNMRSAVVTRTHKCCWDVVGMVWAGDAMWLYGATAKSMAKFPKRDNKVYWIVGKKRELKGGNVPAREI